MLKSSDWRRGVESVRDLGPSRALSLATETLQQRYQAALVRRFDRRFGVDTAGITQLDGLTVPDGDKKAGCRYEGMYVGLAAPLWSLLPSDLSGWTFVDFGAGKGLAILLAAELNFKTIIGVEFTQELCTQMEANIRSYRNPAQRCFDLRAVCADAGRFPIPDGDCVLFFFNPFECKVLQKVVANIEASVREQPRRVLVLYFHPNGRTGVPAVLDGMKGFRRSSSVIRSIRFRLLSPWDAFLYESVP